MTRFHTLQLFLTTAAQGLLRNPATKIPATPKTVCVMQTAQLGDMICTTPMFRAIKTTYPNAKVSVVGSAINKEVVAGNPDVDDYIIWNSNSKEMAAVLREHAFDFACMTTPNFPGLAAFILARIPCIVVPQILGGACPTDTTFYRALSRFVLRAPHHFGTYAGREYLRLLEPLGIHTKDTKKYVYFSDEAKISVEVKLREFNIATPFAVLTPSAGNKIKRWPAERFAKVARHIVQQGMPVCVIGAVGDRDEVRDFFASLYPTAPEDQRIYNLSEQLSIDEMKAFISQAALFVSVDTGPLYVAESFGVPTIDIVGPVSEHDQPPHGPKNIVIVPTRERPAMYALNARMYNVKEAKRQAEATTAGEVMLAVDTLCKN